MEYVCVKWKHEHLDEPVLIYSELDESRLEVRKVEIFRDGTSSYADRFTEVGTTGLSEKPYPSLSEINTNEEFESKSVSAADFERIWKSATS